MTVSKFCMHEIADICAKTVDSWVSTWEILSQSSLVMPKSSSFLWLTCVILMLWAT